MILFWGVPYLLGIGIGIGIGIDILQQLQLLLSSAKAAPVVTIKMVAIANTDPIKVLTFIDMTNYL